MLCGAVRAGRRTETNKKKKQENPVVDKCLSQHPRDPLNPQALVRQRTVGQKVDSTTYIPVYTKTSRLPFMCVTAE